MKIIKLQAENVKRLSAVEITPDGNLVQITGRNGQGKTSVLDSIWWALSGGESIQAHPIRKGADSARIELTLGDGQKAPIVVERRFTEKASYLSVKTADGAKYSSPQKLLDELLGKLTFDPLAFMREKPAGQVEILRRLVPLDVDVDALDRSRADIYTRRTDVGRRAKDLEVRANAMRVADDAPDAEIDTVPILDKLTSADSHNGEIRARERAVADARSGIATMRSRAADLERQLAEALAALEAGERELQELEAMPAAEPIDAAAVRGELKAAQAANEKARYKAERARVMALASAEREREEDLSSRIAGIDEQKRAAIARASMPVDGLSFGEGAVTFNGLPLDQASDAEQLKVSTAIAAALNPKLRVIRIRDGSLLDDQSMEWLAKFAAERDQQIWVERVDGSGTVGIVMEDGHVRGQEPRTEAAE